MNMNVSVIVPVYNVEKYLRECVESILAQTYKLWEIILVDDGSTDSSGKICDEYKDKYNIIKVIHKTNQGLGMARNTGLDNATGDYVYFLDSDDYIEKYEIESLVQGVIHYGVDACYVGFQAVDDSKVVLRQLCYMDEYFEGSEAKNKLLPRMFGSSPDLNDGIEMSSAGQLYSRSVIEENNIRFVSERNLISEDLVFNIDFLQCAKGACTLSRIGYYYRMNPKSLSHTYQSDRFEKSRDFYVIISSKIRELGYDEGAINRLKRTFFINIRSSITQELYSGGNKSFLYQSEKIKKMCIDDVTQEAIKSYPVKKMNIKQRVFLFLVRRKLVLVLRVLLFITK